MSIPFYKKEFFQEKQWKTLVFESINFNSTELFLFGNYLSPTWCWVSEVLFSFWNISIKVRVVNKINKYFFPFLTSVEDIDCIKQQLHCSGFITYIDRCNIFMAIAPGRAEFEQSHYKLWN